jgi:predicted GH43/DUF377 family glycosyl hydrolase
MVFVKREGVILKSSGRGFENQAVLNPTCIKGDGDEVHMFYRAVREGNHSSIGYARLEGPLKVVERAKKPVLYPEYDYESHGLEDPRVVFLDGKYYIFYTVFDGRNALSAYATSRDLKKFKKKGVITPTLSYDEAEDYFRESKLRLKEKYFFFESYYKDIMGKDVLLWEKDVFMFPRKINGKFALVHRILPDIQVIYFKDFKELTNEYWRNYLKHLSDYVILESKYWYESRNIGGGCQPIETEKGWLLIYHAVQDSNEGKVYHMGAALLDKKNPLKVLGHLKDPLLSPETKFECFGDVNNVIFPSGALVFDEKLYVYYGAADKRIAVASMSLGELLEELQYEDTTSDVIADIGFTAGEVFQSSLKKPVKLAELKKNLNLSDKMIMLALGWLAKEGKLELLDVKGGKVKTQE